MRLFLIRLFCKFPIWVPTLIVVGLICYLTLVPDPLGDEDIPLFPGADKIVHFIMFGTLSTVTALDWWRYRGKRLNTLQALFWGLASSIAGALIEIAQQEMNVGRSGDLLDLFADCIGAFAGSFVALWLSGQHSSQS